MGALSHQKPVSIRNSEFMFTLQIRLTVSNKILEVADAGFLCSEAAMLMDLLK
jgi:hypothetical protein